MRYTILIILFFCSLFANSQTRNTYTRIPASQEIISPGRGAEIWHNEFAGNIVNTISETVYQSPLDIYQRSPFTWDLLEPTQNNYDFSSIDALFRWAIPLRKKVGFCLMSQWPDRNPSENPGAFYDGYTSSYPEYLHDLMQAEPVNSRDYVRANTWIPNYNSENYLSRMEALLNALAAHINNTTFQGVRYSDALGYVDIGLYGSWGEWNQVFVHNHPSDYPPGRQPLYQSLNRIIDAHSNAFPNHQIIFNITALDGRQLDNVWVPDETGYHALISQNNFGKFGICKKSWGWPTSWFTSIWLDENPNVFNGMRFDTAAGNRWRYAPINGEGPGGGTAISDPENGLFNDVFMGLLPNQVRRFRISQLGNGNFGGEHLTSVRGRDSLRLAWRLMGYRIYLDSVVSTTSPAANGSFSVSIYLNNEGVAPVYEHWKYVYELRNSTTGVVAWRDTSGIEMRLKMGVFSRTDNFTLTSVPAGTYRLHLRIVEPSGYRDPFPLAINGRQSDGSYILRSNITVTSSGNLPPTANAGTDRNITLPTNSVTLNGSGNDPDGTLVGGQWTRVSGPATFTIVSPTSATTQVTNLVAGTYVFRLTVTDNLGATGFDDVSVIVNSSAPSNLPPVANAGANQVIQLPTSTATLSGSATDADGTIASYAWVQLSGPNTVTLDAHSSASTNVSGLQAGVYTFRLTAVDDDGDSGTDDVQITVTAANVAPTANAGADRTITLPTNTTNLSGAGSDSDGSITGYLWTKVSGPTGGAISSPNTAGTAITGLIQGVYVYRLRVTDNQGATATDEVTITVNPSVPQVPGNWIFTIDPSPAQQDDGQGVVLGVKFRSTQAGAITQLRFWKTFQNTGTHVGALYSSTGTLLWSGTFTNETSIGWQYINTDTVFIDANTTYIAAVFMPTGFYGSTSGYFNNAAVNNMLTAPTSSSVGGNGVYIYSSNLAFPSLTFGASNYWIDVNYQNIEAPSTPNIGPSVSAGLDQTIRLPQDTVILNGTATDSDGTIASVDWAQLSGPNTAQISDTTALNPTIRNLIPGVYQFLLTVRDDDGAVSTDIIAIAVNGAATNWQRRRTYMFNNRRIYFRR